MRVIREGRPQEEQCECPICNSIIGYYEDEVQKFTKVENGTGAIPGTGGAGVPFEYIEITDRYINCPVCGSYVDLGTEFHVY